MDSLTDVEEIGRYVITCSDDQILSKVEDPFELGALDHLVYRTVPIQVLFVYRTVDVGVTSECLLPMTLCKTALSSLLNYYPHLTGRLRFNATTDCPFISAIGTGAALIEARCNQRLEDIVSQSVCGRLLLRNLPDAGNALLAPFDRSLEGVTRDPILAVKHTRFACGGVCLGIRLHHIVCDAQGFFLLVGHLAEIYRSLRQGQRPILAQPPHIRPILRGQHALSPDERKEALKFKPPMYTWDDAVDGDQKLGCAEVPKVPSMSRVEGRTLRMSSEFLKPLKARATGPVGSGWVTTYEALTAYLYQSIYPARIRLAEQSGEGSSSSISPGFLVSMDVRPPHRLNLPPNYFPNATHCAVASSLISDIENRELYQVAKAVHDVIRSADSRQMEQTARWVAAQPSTRNIRLNIVFGNGSLATSQWSKMGMYKGLHFDCDSNGRPIYPTLVSPPFTDISNIDGLVYYLATEAECQEPRENPPPLDVNLALTSAVWKILDEEDEQFRMLSSE